MITYFMRTRPIEKGLACLLTIALSGRTTWRRALQEVVPQKEPSEEKPASGVYPEGSYRVGSDLQAGEYRIYQTDPKRSGYYKISTDANGKEVVSNDVFENFQYIQIEEGEFLELSNSELRLPPYPAQEGKKGTVYLQGAYKIRIDIPAGEYKLRQIDSDYSGFYAITSDANGKGHIANGVFENTHYIEVKDGEFLKIQYCELLLEE